MKTFLFSPPARAAHPIPLITITYVVMAAVSAGLIALVRLPLGEPHWSAVLKTFLFSAGVMLTWQETAIRSVGRSYAPALLTTFAVLFLPSTAALGGAVGAMFLYAALTASWLLGVRSIVNSCRELPSWNVLAAAAWGFLLGGAYFFIVNSKGYANIYSPEQTLLGIQHRDTLFHAALASMLTKYGVVSTGLDGLVSTPYHFLSHALIGFIGRWLGVGSIHAYYLVPQIVEIPLLFFSLSTATYFLCRPEHRPAAGLLAVFVPLALLFIVEIEDWASYWESESYQLGLILLLLTLPLLFELTERRNMERVLLRNATLYASAFAIFLAKNSVGMIFSVGLLYALIRKHGLTAANLVKFGAPITAIAALGLILTTRLGDTGVSPFGPLHFVDTYPDAAWPNIIAILIMVALATCLWASKKAKEPLCTEILLVIVMASLITGLSLRAGAGSAYYFLNVGTWIAILFTSAWLLQHLVACKRPIPITGAAALIAVAAALLAPQKRESPSAVLAMFRNLEQQSHAQAQRDGVVTGARPPWSKVFSPTDLERAYLAESLARSVGGRLKHLLIDVARSGRSDQVAHVPPDNKEFWKMHKLCTAQPFFIPAVAGIPLLNGLPPSDLCPIGREVRFGYGFYSDASRSVPLDDPQLCDRARRIGFAEVIVLITPDTYRTVMCR